MSQNTKLMVRQKGGTLTQVHSPMPTIESPDEVIIELKAIAFNPADHKMIYDGSRVTSWPFVPGLDGAGLVVAVGRKVTRLAVGDEVLALFTAGDREAAYQSFAVVKEGRIARKPKSWTFEEAASIGYVIRTATVPNVCSNPLWRLNQSQCLICNRHVSSWCRVRSTTAIPAKWSREFIQTIVCSGSRWKLRIRSINDTTS